MFRTITRLIFGGEEETPQDAKSGEVVDEEWLVVNYQEAGSAENQGAAEQIDTRSSDSAVHGDTVANEETDTSVVDPEPMDQSSSTTTSRANTGSVSRPKALVEVTPLTCIQKAKTLSDRHYMTRNAIQRQNRVRQGVQHHFFHLQQPGHRNLCH